MARTDLGQTRHVDPEPAAADADRHPSVLRARRSGRRRGGQVVLLDPAGVDGEAVRAVGGVSGLGEHRPEKRQRGAHAGDLELS
jgi:hypothetical protein